MSNFTARARLKGSDGEFKLVTLVDNYFGEHQYGVRFMGGTTFYREEEVEFEKQ